MCEKNIISSTIVSQISRKMCFLAAADMRRELHPGPVQRGRWRENPGEPPEEAPGAEAPTPDRAKRETGQPAPDQRDNSAFQEADTSEVSTITWPRISKTILFYLNTVIECKNNRISGFSMR